ncbi:MAG: hypothetical protein ACP5HS_09145 [Anaerolineae bacterium]
MPAPVAAMSNQPCDEQAVYRIRVASTLDARWSGWLGGMQISPIACGETFLTGPVRDQAALHGLLAKIRDMGLVLISLQRLP